MSSKLLKVRVLITELPTLVEKRSNKMDLNNTPEPMSLPINDLPELNQGPLLNTNISEEIRDLTAYYITVYMFFVVFQNKEKN